MDDFLSSAPGAIPAREAYAAAGSAVTSPTRKRGTVPLLARRACVRWSRIECIVRSRLSLEQFPQSPGGRASFAAFHPDLAGSALVRDAGCGHSSHSGGNRLLRGPPMRFANISLALVLFTAGCKARDG